MELSVIITLTVVLIIVGAILNVLSDLVADELRRYLPYLTGRRVVLTFGALVALLAIVTIFQFFVVTPERASTSSVTPPGTPIQIRVATSVPPDPAVAIIQPYPSATNTAINPSPTATIPSTTTRTPATISTMPLRSSPTLGISHTGIRILNFFGAPILLTINGRAYKIDPSLGQPFQIELLPGTYPYSANVLDPHRASAHNQVTVKAGQWTDLTFVSAPD